MSQINSVVVGIVKSKPDRHGQIELHFPWLPGSNKSAPARVATLMAGSKRGSWFMPEIGDEVLVAFEHGDIQFPYIVGSLWNGEDEPPEADPQKRSLNSKNGHKIQLYDPKVIDGDRGHIRFEDAQGNRIELANGRISIIGEGVIEIAAKHGVSINGRPVLPAPGADLSRTFMADSKSIPCLEFPNPKPMKIRLPFGSELKSIMDISKGPPADCTLIHGLMLQLAPALSGMECLLKLFNVIAALKDIGDPPNFTKVITAANQMAECLNFAGRIPNTIIDILKLIIAYLKCIIEATLSLLKFQSGINLNAAQGTVLQHSLGCAQKNAAISMAQLKEALALVQPLLQLLQPILSMAEGPFPAPAKEALQTIPEALATIGRLLEGGGVSVEVQGPQGVVSTLENLKNTLQHLHATLEALG